ncbi:MAG: hypothetical protein GAK33_01465 [Burkholderia lata]|uniref:Uncharacterized protein n=1 Tax=Burkholderia lata (strain ATCC 17760 / DSM 23089 / LMG 22485 / NCIMB 9086 / R18194 / 383) TaxID=482957 RepID=A0A833PY33_BURL3|nr:MAG: hypothetical protein GAK33_01465 [Burkholderia lata]
MAQRDVSLVGEVWMFDDLGVRKRFGIVGAQRRHHAYVDVVDTLGARDLLRINTIMMLVIIDLDVGNRPHGQDRQQHLQPENPGKARWTQ